MLDDCNKHRVMWELWNLNKKKNHICFEYNHRNWIKSGSFCLLRSGSDGGCHGCGWWLSLPAWQLETFSWKLIFPAQFQVQPSSVLWLTFPPQTVMATYTIDQQKLLICVKYRFFFQQTAHETTFFLCVMVRGKEWTGVTFTSKKT